jgi:hypothetical protein
VWDIGEPCYDTGTIIGVSTPACLDLHVL